jgi:glucosyl-dolichyl phosphate glucuronosyltransferase
MIDAAPDISVIICTYTEGRWYHLVAAVESIQQQNTSPREIIVVIDHNPALLVRVKTHISGVFVIDNGESRGLSGARNSGIAVARGALIAFLDDDAKAEPDWLAWLSRCCADPQILGTGGRVVPSWTSKRPTWFPEEFYWVIGCSYRGLPGTRAVVRNPFGGCTCYRREVFETVGGFRNEIGRIGSLPLGCEETELCVRAKRHWPEKVFLWEPQARIHHCISTYRASWHYFRSRCYAEGLSKAIVVQYVGTKDGLASERTYTLQALPKGILRGLIDGFIHLDPAGFLRAGAIIAGLVITAAGYLAETISRLLALTAEASTSAGFNFKRSLHSDNWNTTEGPEDVRSRVAGEIGKREK